KLDAAVEHATNLGGSRVEVAYRIEVDRAWNREYIRVLDHRHLAEADAGLRDRFGCDQADMGLPRVEHLDHLAGRRLVDVDFEPGCGAAAARERVRHQRLDHRVEAGDADNGAFAGAEFAHPRFRLIDLLEHALRMPQQQLA